MDNTQLRALLARTPLSEEDIYNVSTIFHVLPEERKIHILNHWEEFATKLITERNKLDEEQEKLTHEALVRANIILDEAILREKKRRKEKHQKYEETRKNLHFAEEFEKIHTNNNIQNKSHFPSK